MPLFSFVGPKGALGVTTTGLLAAATAGGVFVEADPAGGDLECWSGPHGEPGLIGWSVELETEPPPERLLAHCVELAPGLQGIVAPTTAVAAGTAVARSAVQMGSAMASVEEIVIADCGRWSVDHPGKPILAASSVVVVVCRPTLDAIEHARDVIDMVGSGLGSARRLLAAVVVGGDRPYGPPEIEQALGVPVAGVVPWDPRGLLGLVERGVHRGWGRTSAGRAMTGVWERLAGIAAGAWTHA